MKLITITNENSIVEATDEGDGIIRLAHGMTIGRIEDLSDEQYLLVVELMRGYNDFITEETGRV